MTNNRPSYIGRFAPTPSGPLHIGSLSTALASWLFARTNGGQWIIRIDDLDAARCRSSYVTRILIQLETHGLWWDGTPYHQSGHVDLYRDALSRLKAKRLVYPCLCSRIKSRQEGFIGRDGLVYSGLCRKGLKEESGRVAYRLRTQAGCIFLNDQHLGRLERDVEKDIGDFIVQRADGVIGYYLACAVDEHELGITEIVRGADLLLPSLRHLLILSALELPPIAYRHIPIIVDVNGDKLSKQNGAQPAGEDHAARNLLNILYLLGQNPPPDLGRAQPKLVLEWAIEHWDPGRIPRSSEISISSGQSLPGAYPV